MFSYKAMLSYCMKSRKSTESKATQVLWTKNGSIMLLSKCPVCDKKNLNLSESKNVGYLISSLGIKTLLHRLPLLGPLLF